jgi:hypothetical protein
MNTGSERNEVCQPVTMSSVARGTIRARAVFVEMVTGAMLEDLVRVLYRRAMGGDTAAAKLLLQYGIGVPRRGVGYC